MKFTKRAIEALAPTGKRQVFFDDDFTGFALRVSELGKKSYYFTYRAAKGRTSEKKWVMLGAFPTMTVEQARQKAKDFSADVQRGIDPALREKENKSAPTIKDALEIFSREHVEKLKPRSREQYQGAIDKRIIPALGKLKVTDVQHRHVAQLHHSMRETPYSANRCIAVLSKFFSWAEKNGYRPRASNPVMGIEKFKEHKRLDFMGLNEIQNLMRTIAEMEAGWLSHEEQRTRAVAGTTINPLVAAALRLLIFTGARVSEVLTLKWGYIDIERGTASLPDSKTDFKVLQLPAPALVVLSGLPQVSEWVFPSTGRTGRLVNLKDSWADVLARANVGHWRLHDLRHAFASMMVNSGASLPIIGAILGHKQASTTQRYAHIAENPARKAAEEAAAMIDSASKK